MKKLILTLVLIVAPLSNLEASAIESTSSSLTAKIGAVAGTTAFAIVATPSVSKGFKKVSNFARDLWNKEPSSAKTLAFAAMGASVGIVVYVGLDPACNVACLALEVGSRTAEKAWDRSKEATTICVQEIKDTFRNKNKLSKRLFVPTAVAAVGGFVAVSIGLLTKKLK